MKIELKEPDGPYSCAIDTGVMSVELRETFLGVKFVTESGEKLSVSMRDNGFEVHYYKDDSETKGFDTGLTEFKDGFINCSLLVLRDIDSKP